MEKELEIERRKLYKEMCDRFTFLKYDKSIKYRIKIKMYNFLLKLIEIVDPHKDYSKKIINDANRILDDNDEKMS